LSALCGCWYGGAGRPKELEEAATSLGATRLEILPGHPAAHRIPLLTGLPWRLRVRSANTARCLRATCPWSLKSALIIIGKLDGTTLPGLPPPLAVVMLVIFCHAAGHQRLRNGGATTPRTHHDSNPTVPRPLGTTEVGRRALIGVRWFRRAVLILPLAAVFTGRCAKQALEALKEPDAWAPSSSR
jgi:hypothetical protein